MGLQSRVLLNQVTFTADTQTLNIPADNIKNLQFGIIGQDTSAGAATKAHLKGVFDEVLVDLGGYNICKIRVDDLIAYMMMAYGEYPECFVGGATSLLCELGGIKLPLHVTKAFTGEKRNLNVQFTHSGTATNLGTVTLSAVYEYQRRRFPLHFAYQYESAPTGANVRWTGLQRVDSTLQGLLIYQEIEDMATALTLPEVAQLEMIVDDSPVYQTVWPCMKVRKNVFGSIYDVTDGYGQDFGAAGWSANVGGHYKYIDFSQEPWSANDIEIITKNTCAAYTAPSGGDIRILGVYAEP